jgi:hypothetical protein
MLAAPSIEREPWRGKRKPGHELREEAREFARIENFGD